MYIEHRALQITIIMFNAIFLFNFMLTLKYILFLSKIRTSTSRYTHL